MLSASFQTRYPSLALALLAMSSAAPEDFPHAQPAKDAVASDLSHLFGEHQALDALADELLAGASEPEHELIRISKFAYRYVGVSDQVRLFMGRLWASALRSWNESLRAKFLQLTLQDGAAGFAALDFTAELFALLEFPSTALLPWLKLARVRVGNDLIQHGLWNSVEAICRKSPTAALLVAAEWLTENPDSQSLATIATIVGLVRKQASLDSTTSSQLAALENRLRTSGRTGWRAAYVQSWAHTSDRDVLTLERADNLFDECVTKGGEEEDAWCYLLYVLARREALTDDERQWIASALKRIARPGLSAVSQYWLVRSVLKGLTEASTSTTGDSTDAWIDLLHGLCPIPAGHKETWREITDALVELTESAPSTMRQIAYTLASHSGSEWLSSEDRDEFRWFVRELATHGQHSAVATELCLRDGMYCRRLGLLIFASSAVPVLDPVLVKTASERSIKLLLLEARRVHVDYSSLARLHASLAARVDQLAGCFPELLYEEVSWQCRNTHAYRTALRAAAPDNEYLMAIAADSEGRISETLAAGSSPALQMDVPGYARARALSSCSGQGRCSLSSTLES